MAKRDDFVDHLAQVPLFSACSKKDLQQVAKRAEDVRVEAGKVLVSEGAAGAEFFVILEGEATVTRHGQEVARLGAGQFFGDLALLDRAPRNATITAATPMELVVLGQREFSALIDEVPGFAHKLLAGLARRLREYDAQTTAQ
jgi:CRP/FNR family cyclic AMP-dependent transcriptional regulator